LKRVTDALFDEKNPAEKNDMRDETETREREKEGEGG
jgi:hypothetical protein